MMSWGFSLQVMLGFMSSSPWLWPPERMQQLHVKL